MAKMVMGAKRLPRAKTSAKVHQLSRYGFAAWPPGQLKKALPDTPLSFARWLRRWARRDGPREELAAACTATPRPPRRRPRRTALSIAPSRRRAVAFAKEWPVAGCLPAADPATATALPTAAGATGRRSHAQRRRGALNNEERNSKNELFFREKNETSHRGNCFSGARTKHAIAGIIFQVEERNKPLRELFSREERNKPPRTFIFRRQDRHGTPVALFFLPFAYGLETTGERTAATSM